CPRAGPSPWWSGLTTSLALPARPVGPATREGPADTFARRRPRGGRVLSGRAPRCRGGVLVGRPNTPCACLGPGQLPTAGALGSEEGDQGPLFRAGRGALPRRETAGRLSRRPGPPLLGR